MAFTNNETFPQTDRYTDIGFDTQYQYQGNELLAYAAWHLYSREPNA